MLFEVWRGGVPMMGTNVKECIYSHETLLKMKDSGYEFKYNGKKFVPKKGGEKLNG